MSKKINIKEVYEKLNRELIEKSISNIYKEKDSFFYSPKYQRNYVWDDTKAINLIETILINGEVPPITVMEVNGKLEVIDGRQRIETILKFRNNEFILKQFGLDKLKDLDSSNYDNLPPNVRTIFDEYKIKIILYTVAVNTTFSNVELEYLKRNLFRKYNSGMTSLTGGEIARAKYLYDPLTNYISEKLENDSILLEDCSKILLPPSKRNTLIRERINDILVNIREMLTVTYIPIVHLNTVKLGIKVIDQYYKKFITPQNEKEISKEFFTIFFKTNGFIL